MSTRLERAEYSTRRLNELRGGLEDQSTLLDEAGLCIYATGSYGRLEAWEESDIDLFFLFGPRERDDGRPRGFLPFLRVAGRLVEITEEMGFPPFSGDGRYLETLDVIDMERQLGSRDDDSTNTFTARMLLLLESEPVSAKQRYSDLIERIVGFYFRDFQDHQETFVPTFLSNDILRFWRTLTLNYEHDRFKSAALPKETQRESALVENSVKNYKLKVSRLATCFSMIVHLAAEDPPVTAVRVIELTGMTPAMRFASLRDRRTRQHATCNIARLLDSLEEQYDRFLDRVQRPTSELMTDFSHRDTRRECLEEAAQYGHTIYELLDALVEPERMRHLVI